MAIYIIAFVLLLLLELFYFKIADHFNIIDKPNSRSSHTQITLRGGAIIFPLAAIFAILFYQNTLIYLALAIFLIALISFLDDIMTLNNKLRIGVHIISVALIIFQVWINFDTIVLDPIPNYLLWFIPVYFILVIGIINAYNFMDGINGITVLYSIVTVISIWMVQKSLELTMLSSEIWWILLASLTVFGFFNLRKKAKTFAGDVGSISIALLICYLIMSLIGITGDLKWLLLLGIYGLDAVATIFCRIIRKENIFDAHRSHFYQYLANDQKIPHVAIALVYASAQGILNIVIILLDPILAYTCFIVLTAIYIIARLRFEGKNRLFRLY